MGENGRPQLTMEFNTFETPENGVVVGEYVNGEWEPRDFVIETSRETRLAHFRLASRFYRDHFGVVTDSRGPVGMGYLVYGGARIEGVKFDYVEQGGETSLFLAAFHRGSMYSLEVDNLVYALHGASSEDSNLIDPKALTVGEISKVLEFIDESQGRNVHASSVSFSSMFFASNFDAQEFCGEIWPQSYTTDRFIEYCLTHASGDYPRSVGQAQAQINKIRILLSESAIRRGLDLWDGSRKEINDDLWVSVSIRK